MSYNINQNVEKFIVLMNPANISTSDQSCFNVVDQRWKNVDPTLIQRWYNVSARRWNSVEITLMQRFFNLASTLVKPILNQIGLVVIVDCVIVMHVKYMMVFILLNEKVFFYYILTIEVLMKYKKKFLKIKKQWYISQYTVLVTMLTYTEAWNVAFKTTKLLRKI